MKQLRIGRIAYTSPDSILINHHSMVQYLSKLLEVPAEMKLFRSYEEIFRQIQSGKLELAWVGTAFYGGIDQAFSTPIVAPLWYGKKNYRGQFLVRSDSEIKTLEELIGKKVAFVAKSSSSGFFFPRLLLRENQIQLNDLHEYAFLEKHDAVVYAVLTKQFDAGATYEGILELSRFRKQKNRFRILAKTLDIPNEPILVSNRISGAMVSRIRKAFLDAKKAGVLESVSNLEGFYEVSESTYLPVRDLVENAE
ncbi:phosphate/phosphite/phosphonate ABC transporter substrate-binding protein [bacterium]|nr:phosphate/phosphite/phosphonate ABC transporter substrate-binding protein [bacterium]